MRVLPWQRLRWKKLRQWATGFKLRYPIYYQSWLNETTILMCAKETTQRQDHWFMTLFYVRWFLKWKLAHHENRWPIKRSLLRIANLKRCVFLPLELRLAFTFFLYKSTFLPCLSFSHLRSWNCGFGKNLKTPRATGHKNPEVDIQTRQKGLLTWTKSRWLKAHAMEVFFSHGESS